MIIRSGTLRYTTKLAPTMGEVEKYPEGNHPVKVKECPVGPETLCIWGFGVCKGWISYMFKGIKCHI